MNRLSQQLKILPLTQAVRVSLLQGTLRGLPTRSHRPRATTRPLPTLRLRTRTKRRCTPSEVPIPSRTCTPRYVPRSSPRVPGSRGSYGAVAVAGSDVLEGWRGWVGMSSGISGVTSLGMGAVPLKLHPWEWGLFPQNHTPGCWGSSLALCPKSARVTPGSPCWWRRT